MFCCFNYRVKNNEIYVVSVVVKVLKLLFHKTKNTHSCEQVLSLTKKLKKHHNKLMI